MDLEEMKLEGFDQLQLAPEMAKCYIKCRKIHTSQNKNVLKDLLLRLLTYLVS